MGVTSKFIMKLNQLTLRFVCFVLIVGCGQSALLNMREQNIETEKRIAAKEQMHSDLKAENESLLQQQTALKKKQAALIADLKNQQMTLQELEGALSQLRREYEHTVAETQTQALEKVEIERQLAQYEDKLNALERTGMSAAEKQAYLESLKAQIKKYLEIMMEM